MTETLEGKIVRAPPEEQPAVVIHRMYWQGESQEEEEVNAKMLTEALGKMLASLSIDRLSIGLQDVVAPPMSTWTLESLEIRDVVPDNEAGEPILPILRSAQSNKQTPANNLPSSLTATSHARLETLFKKVGFPALTSLSLRLPRDAVLTDFNDLLLNGFKKDLKDGEKPRFELRCRLPSTDKQALDRLLKHKRVYLDYEELS
ncbi:hypothetical protein NMY22_g14124 [Coprinellus aureogranulatus]|nr:hypothetical protein NMY22_g14124 [Coprinellus aureogranulatus]